MQKIKKSVTLSNEIMNMIKQLCDILQITENSVISVAIFEYYNKNLGKNE